MDKVTVCIPTYNRAGTISNSINSVLKQTYKNIEIIVVDNASTDNTKEVVLGFNDDRIRYIYFSEHLGVNYNFMRAINCSNTEIVCLFHSDDYYLPNIIENQIKYIKEYDCGAVFSKMIKKQVSDTRNIETCITEDEVSLSKGDDNAIIYDYKNFFINSLCNGITISCPTFMTKKSVIRKVGLIDKKNGLISDLSLWMSIVREYKIVDIQKPLMIYSISNDQLSYKIHNRRDFVSPQFIVLDNELLNSGEIISKKVLKKYNKRKSKDYLYISRNSILKLRLIKGFKYLIKSFILQMNINTRNLQIRD